jgi:hypothetical protein
MIVLPGDLSAESAVSSWSIEPVLVGTYKGIFNQFSNVAGADRESQNANSLQWFDEDGYKILLSGWGFSLEQLLELAATLGPTRD